MKLLTYLRNWFAGLWAAKKIDNKTEQAKKEIAAVVEDVVDIVDEAKSKAIEEVKEKGEQVTHSIKRRARDSFGRFLRDDPKTPENEAYVDVKVDKDDKDEK
tara:strand:+ start:257 stop:562 length:306 start_codon:yes stop_codon:yes gene_type:complete